MDTQQLLAEYYTTPELIPPDPKTINPDNVWVDYDVESDILVIYLTKKPVPGVSYHIGNNLIAITPFDSNTIIGFQIEAWEKEFVPSQEQLAERWPNIRRSLSAERTWSPMLVLMALLLLTGYFLKPGEDEHLALALTPA